MLAASWAMTELAENWLTPAKSKFRIPLNRLPCRPPVKFVLVMVVHPLDRKLVFSEITVYISRTMLNPMAVGTSLLAIFLLTSEVTTAGTRTLRTFLIVMNIGVRTSVPPHL